MSVPESEFYLMRLPTIVLRASVGLEGPYVAAWDGNGDFVGSAPLGHATIGQANGPRGPWWICQSARPAIALPWCGPGTVRAVARNFGIVGEGMDVRKHFYGSPAWDGLVDLVANTRSPALRWRDRDAYCRGWVEAAMRQVRGPAR